MLSYREIASHGANSVYNNVLRMLRFVMAVAYVLKMFKPITMCRQMIVWWNKFNTVIKIEKNKWYFNLLIFQRVI